MPFCPAAKNRDIPISIKNNIKLASIDRVMKRVQKILQPVRFLGGGATGSGGGTDGGGDEGGE